MLDFKTNERFRPYERMMEDSSSSIDESYPQARFFHPPTNHHCKTIQPIVRRPHTSMSKERPHNQIINSRIRLEDNNNSHAMIERKGIIKMPNVCKKGHPKKQLNYPIKTTQQNITDRLPREVKKECQFVKMPRSNSSVASSNTNAIGDTLGNKLCSNKNETKCISRSFDDINDVVALRKDKMILMRRLGSLEEKAFDIQNNVKKINEEKDHIKSLYNKSQDEVNRLKMELNRTKGSNEAWKVNSSKNVCQPDFNVIEMSSKLNATLRQIETEKDKALYNLERVSAERDNVIAKYRIDAASNHSSAWYYTRKIDSLIDEKRRVEESCNDKEEKIKIYQRDMNEMRMRIDKYEKSFQDFASNQERLKVELKQANDHRLIAQGKADEMHRDLLSFRQTSNDFKQKYDSICQEKHHLEKELNIQKAELLRSSCQLNAIEKRYDNLKNDLHVSQNDNESLKEENKGLRNSLREVEDKLQQHERSLQEERDLRLNLERANNEYEKRNEETEFKLLHFNETILKNENELKFLNDKLKCFEETISKCSLKEETLTRENHKFRNTLELANKDKFNLEKYIDELKRANEKLSEVKLVQEEEIKSRCVREKNLEDLITQLEFDMKKKVEMINFEKESKDEIASQRDTFKARYENLEGEFYKMKGEAKAYEKNVKQLETACKRLDEQQEKDSVKFKDLRNQYQRLESEKKQLEAANREMSEKMRSSEGHFDHQAKMINEAKSQLNMLERNNEMLQAQLTEKSSDLRTCQSELEELKKFINESRMCMETNERDLIKYQEENERIAKEYSIISSELAEQTRLRCNLENTLTEHMSSIPKLQQALEEMNNERCALTQQLQDSIEELKNWRMRWESSEKECKFFKSECEQLKADYVREREKNDSLERDFIQIKSLINSNEMQISTLTKISNDAQEKNREYQTELEHLIQETNNLRDNLNRSNSSKCSMESELINKQIELDQLKGQLDELEMSLQQKKENISQERAQNKSLQRTIEEDRERITKYESLLRDNEKEFALLRDKLEDFQHQNKCLNKEIGRMKMIFMEAEQETNRLSKSLAMEKCERERLISEARMNSLPTEYKPSGYLSNYMQNKSVKIDEFEKN